MSKKTNGVNYKKNPQVTERRKQVISRLEDQLKTGSKRTKSGLLEELSDKDVKRIEREIQILKSRV